MSDAPPVIIDALAKPNQQYHLGRAIASKVDAVFGGKRISRAGKFHQATRWQVLDATVGTAPVDQGEDGRIGEDVCPSSRGAKLTPPRDIATRDGCESSSPSSHPPLEGPRQPAEEHAVVEDVRGTPCAEPGCSRRSRYAGTGYRCWVHQPPDGDDERRVA